VVLIGCGHADAVHIVRHALRLTGVHGLTALLGGFHLAGPAFEPIIEPTVAAPTALAPELIVPAHRTGWKARYRFSSALPEAFVPNAVGTTCTLTASADWLRLLHATRNPRSPVPFR
jgi:7,8-dihydropterin-6-yl-methyl-4-(beta-D-ribofuranosyl)aminobenzene 5'-phosphate synthase